MERDDLLYAAGLFDGEGCITTAVEGPNQMPDLRVSVKMTDPAVIRWLHETFKVGRVFQYRQSHRTAKGTWYRPYFYWQCGAVQAERVLGQLLPYLKVKRQQAERGLALRRIPRLSGNQARWLHLRSGAEQENRADALTRGRRLRLEISSLNKTGTLPG